jgi:hypothetical protein
MKGPCVLTLRTGTTERYLSDDNGRTVYFPSYERAYSWAEANGFNAPGNRDYIALADESISLDALKARHGSNVTPFSGQLKLRVHPIATDSLLPERSA